MRKVIIFLLIVLTLPLVLGDVSCNPSSVATSYEQGQNITETIQCTNNGNTTVTITKSGDFTIDQSVIGQSPSSKTITITFNPDSSLGFNSGKIQFDGTDDVQISFFVEDIPEPEPEEGCRLIELPHTTSYRIKQGETTSSGTIRLKVSSECTTLSMSVTEDVQMSKPMFLQGQSGDISPGEEFSFSIGLDAVNVETGTYTNTYIVSGSEGDNVYSKRITLSTIVTAGTSPITNSSFSTLPTCTLDSDMKLNQTYSFVCNNENPNLKIEPLYNHFFEGVSVSEGGGRYEYRFKPLFIGNTQFKSIFTYKGASIGTPFTKDVRIFVGDVPISGTGINIAFYQNQVKKEMAQLLPGTITLLARDSGNNNIINEITIYLNGVQKNNSFNVQSGIEYELIVDALGYSTKTLNFTLNPDKININLNPSKTNYLVGDIINISTDVSNTTLLVGGSLISNPYTLNQEGNITINAKKEGFLDGNITIKVKNKVNILSSLPENVKKGDELIFELNRDTEWSVKYQEDVESNIIQKGAGTNNQIIFEIDKKGTYWIVADGVTIWSEEVEGGFFSQTWVKWGMGIIGAIIILYLIISGMRKPKPKESGMTFEPK